VNSHDTSTLLKQTSIQFAITIDCIWSLRNRVIHDDYKVSILTIIKTLESKIIEKIHALEDTSSEASKSDDKWIAPSHDTLKLNVDLLF
jgi:uncharacterized protein with HEPN domain